MKGEKAGINCLNGHGTFLVARKALRGRLEKKEGAGEPLFRRSLTTPLNGT